ncbi:CBS domain-containing protein [Methanocella conradii]|uniref:CBS domain-containing protein n=1 Tax=Methanocella conradii TaxID=1175444 RepID=UPI00157C3B0B|nr:CBS domain-containing protein [Methanocella conradii]MDI6897992.1 CBS domain-containing protein [Methanocella conradii]
METDLSVSDVMSRRLITADVSETADRLGRIMADAGVGCIIITKEGHPIGIVTERDLVVKIISKNRQPSKVKAQDIMSTPLITIPPDKSVELASREMARRRIRRLPVVQDRKLIGMVSDSDLILVSSELGEILRDIIRQNNPEGEFAVESEWEAEEKTPTVFVQGICEVCGNLAESLEYIDGAYVCTRCREELSLYQ